MTQPFDLTAARSLLEHAAQSSEFTSFMGTRLRHLEAGQVEIEIDLRPPLTQHHGYAHGAVVGYLADTASAWAAATLAGDVVTAEYKLNLLAPARGELLWARAEVLRSGRSHLIVRADVFARSGGLDSYVGACLSTIVPVRKKQSPA
ncbi:MAG: PaaI family thioesterase [Deinococcus sp.]|nr:PaaI family thioesterase [Deinococcus sp.]